MTNEFLPQGYTYEKPKVAGRYYKFTEGDNIFRVLSPAITGWEDWSVDKKPIRTVAKPEFPAVQGKYPKQFWAFVVFDYEEEDESKMLKILQITQASIMEAMFNLHTNVAWGDPKNYDLNINRSGKELDTKYQVMPSPPSATNPKAVELYNKTKISLEKLFSNGDPFEEDKDVETNTDRGTQINDNQPPLEEPEERIANIPF